MEDIAEDIQLHYKKLGLLFHIKQAIIDKIARQNDKDSEEALKSVVYEWINCNFDRSTKDGKDPTRRWLVKAVEKINPRLADDLKAKYT